jgi:DNA-binding LacI/PurR family transcriptional regulator
MENITLNDLAKETGFSIKTISRVVNSHPDVRLETRETIQKIIDKYNYKPNPIAKSLRKNVSNVIGYIVPDIVNEFFGELAFAIENEFKKHGYNILVGFTNADAKEEINLLKLLISSRVAGIILATVGTTGELVSRIINEARVPIVIIDNKVKGYKTNFVLHDNENGAYVLTKHLIEHKYNNIACITGPIDQTSGKKRLDGYMKALNDYGIKINNEFIKISDWKISGGYKATLELFKKTDKKPRAIFLSNSIMALGSLKALRELNLKVPSDVAIVSFDNLSFTEATNPPLTTLESVEHEIGEKAAKILFNRIKTSNLEKIEEVYVKPDICLRQSCGCNY